MNFDISFLDLNPFFPFLAFLGVFALVAVALMTIIKAVRRAIHKNKFGDLSLLVDNDMGVFGTTMRGHLVTSKLIEPQGDWLFTLKCIETRISKHNSKTYSEEIILWQAESKVSRSAHVSTDGIPYFFLIDKNCLRKKKDGTISWKILVMADLSGANFRADYPVKIVERAPQGYGETEAEMEEKMSGSTGFIPTS